MANEIDLYNDLEEVEKKLKDAKTWVKVWENERKNIVKTIKEQYPDLVLSK